ncbi:MAG: 3-deoxy-7-phosphoheptulonate synthase [Tissierellia bacterium]|nr:3-deoxy-7-phosphoheptulonate synthase [Tissierellia bacterium]
MGKIEEIINSNQAILIAGPCSIESKEHIMDIAQEVKKSGANILRGGAFKPRTSPYTFQGLGAKAVSYLVEAGKNFGLPTVSEVVDIRDIDLFKDVDMIQVGARNMQNFSLLRELGKLDKYILLKRNMGSTVEELLLAAEYIRSEGNEKIILCERGIRTFENSTRYTLDLNMIPVIHQNTKYKVLVDPSHGTGDRKYVESMTYAGMAAGADGFIIEVARIPEKALTDAQQALETDKLKRVVEKSKNIYKLIRE